MKKEVKKKGSGKRQSRNSRWLFEDELRGFINAGLFSLLSEEGNRMTWGGWSCNLIVFLLVSLPMSAGTRLSLNSLPAQAILWFYDSSPSFSGSWWTRMMIAHSPKLLIPQPQGTSATMHILGEGAGGVFCHTTTACCPFGGNERRRTREVPAEHLMTQPVLEWKPCWEGGWWIGCEVVWSWVMKWLFKTGEPDGPAKNWHCN